MTADQFERVVRWLTVAPSRRGVAGLIAGSALAWLLPGSPQPATAKKRGGKGKGKKKRCRARSFVASPMTGANEVPAVITMESGSAHFTIKCTGKGRKICGTFQFSGAGVTGTHIHPGAAGVEGGILVDFGAAIGQQVCVKCPKGVCEDILANPAGFYANTHTMANPDGEVRAQLAPA
jgi:hypothetical protein